MSIIVEIIAEHLQSNRRLVIPTFGAFMVKESGEMVFSDLLRTDDGVLTSLLHSRGFNEMEAAVTIDRFIFEVRHELEQYGYCLLGEVGTLRVEPDTKVLRLYPPVKGQVEFVDKPFVPKLVISDEVEAVELTKTPAATEPSVQGVLALYDEPKTEEKVVVEEETSTPQPEEKHEETVPPTVAPQPKAKRRMKFDLVMVVAVAVLLMALAAIAYGIYVATPSDYASEEVMAQDDADMDALRTIKNE